MKAKRRLLLGDCLKAMQEMPCNSVDSVVTDPPYGIAFMAKKWDYNIPSVEIWEECLRVLKPGGHALIACGTRTQHRMVCNIEDAGFEIRDVISWMYSTGFPKSLSVSKAIDKAAGAEREVVGKRGHSPSKGAAFAPGEYAGLDTLERTTPATKAAKQWDGWGTALKPACEFWTLCRKPLSEKTVAANVLKWGTGGINIGGCWVGTETITSSGNTGMDARRFSHGTRPKDYKASTPPSTHQGRFPANLIHDGSQEVMDLFPVDSKKASGKVKVSAGGRKDTGEDWKATKGMFRAERVNIGVRDHGDSGSIARFFYCAKASKRERNQGLKEGESNTHATVKPVSLMRYLCRLITPPKGIVLDPFMGSGTTGIGAKLEGFKFIGIEREEEYYQIALKRTK